MQNGNRTLILSQRYVLDVLTFIFKEKEIICSNLNFIIKSPTTRNKTVKMLVREDLLSVRTVTKPRLTYFITLTEKGVAVANHLSEIDKVMSGETTIDQTYCTKVDQDGKLKD